MKLTYPEILLAQSSFVSSTTFFLLLSTSTSSDKLKQRDEDLYFQSMTALAAIHATEYRYRPRFETQTWANGLNQDVVVEFLPFERENRCRSTGIGCL